MGRWPIGNQVMRQQNKHHCVILTVVHNAVAEPRVLYESLSKIIVAVREHRVPSAVVQRARPGPMNEHG